jgi:hypothetical protein
VANFASEAVGLSVVQLTNPFVLCKLINAVILCTGVYRNNSDGT